MWLHHNSTSGQSQVSSIEISPEQQALLTKTKVGLTSTVISADSELSLEDNVVQNTSIQDKVVVKDSSIINDTVQESVLQEEDTPNVINEQDTPRKPELLKNK